MFLNNQYNIDTNSPPARVLTVSAFRLSPIGRALCRGKYTGPGWWQINLTDAVIQSGGKLCINASAWS